MVVHTFREAVDSRSRLTGPPFAAYRGDMRWDALFGDLDAQWHAATQQDLEREVNELSRVESAQATLADALRGALGREISAVTRNGVAHHGQLQRVEEQWVLLGDGARSVIVPVNKVLRVQGLAGTRVSAAGRVRHTLASALRVLARNRAVVLLDLDSPQPTRVRGVLDQVGADFVVVMQLADGVGRGRDNMQGSVVLPQDGLLSIMSSAENEL